MTMSQSAWTLDWFLWEICSNCSAVLELYIQVLGSASTLCCYFYNFLLLVYVYVCVCVFPRTYSGHSLLLLCLLTVFTLFHHFFFFPFLVICIAFSLFLISLLDTIAISPDCRLPCARGSEGSGWYVNNNDNDDNDNTNKDNNDSNNNNNNDNNNSNHPHRYSCLSLHLSLLICVFLSSLLLSRPSLSPSPLNTIYLALQKGEPWQRHCRSYACPELWAQHRAHPADNAVGR